MLRPTNRAALQDPEYCQRREQELHMELLDRQSRIAILLQFSYECGVLLRDSLMALLLKLLCM